MKVGFIGLGMMGGPIALNAIRGGNELVVHDIRRESATPIWRWERSGPTRLARWRRSPR